MTTERDIARQLLTEQVLDATTLEEIQKAREALRDWIQNYPEEREWMRDGFEQLAQMEEIAHLSEAEPMPTAQPVIIG